MSNADNDNKRYYLAIWKELLPVLLGWSEAQVMEWVKQTRRGKSLDDPDAITFHETPQYWITYLLIPETLKARLSNLDIIDLERRILIAFRDHHHYHFPLGTDWRPYRAKIEQILSEYGEHLPPPAVRHR